MDLYLIPNNPERTALVSVNGTSHYRIETTKPLHGPRVTSIHRPANFPGDTIVAEIEWRSKGSPTIIRSPLLSGVGRCVGTQGIGIRASHYLYKRHRFSPSRYFIGDDALEYQWKINVGIGFVLTRSGSNEEVASSIFAAVSEGLFAGEKKQALRIQPCSLDIDLVVLTFIIMEKKRRDRDGYGFHELAHTEDPQGDGGGSGEGGEAGADTGAGVIGEL